MNEEFERLVQDRFPLWNVSFIGDVSQDGMYSDSALLTMYQGYQLAQSVITSQALELLNQYKLVELRDVEITKLNQQLVELDHCRDIAIRVEDIDRENVTLKAESIHEREILRQVYEMARGLLRFNGVDKEKTVEYADKLDDAIEQVKLFYSSNYENHNPKEVI